MTIKIVYKEVPPIVQNIFRANLTAYYRGIKVGTVEKIRLSDDQKSIEFYLAIRYKNLKLPCNINFILKTEDLFAARYFSIEYPPNPSPHFLADGDVIMGTAYYPRLDQYLVSQFEKGKLKTIEDNLIEITNVLKTALKGNNSQIINQLSKSSSDIGIILDSIKNIIKDPQVSKDIKSTLHYSSSSVKDINQLLQDKDLKTTIQNSPQLIDKTLSNLDKINTTLPEVNTNVQLANKNITDTNNKLDTTNIIVASTNSTLKSTVPELRTTNKNLKQVNAKIPNIPPHLLEKADNSLTMLDCLNHELGKLVNKRFLLLRLMFGTPAKGFSNCSKENLNPQHK